MCRASTPNNYQAVADCDASDDCVGFAVKKLGGDFYVTYSDLACVETNAYEDEGGHWDLYVSSNLTSEDHTYGAALYFCDFDFDFDYTRRYFWRDTGECRPCPASASVAELALNCSAVTDAKYVPHGASVSGANDCEERCAPMFSPSLSPTVTPAPTLTPAPTITPTASAVPTTARSPTSSAPTVAPTASAAPTTTAAPTASAAPTLPSFGSSPPPERRYYGCCWGYDAPGFAVLLLLLSLVSLGLGVRAERAACAAEARGSRGLSV